MNSISNTSFPAIPRTAGGDRPAPASLPTPGASSDAALAAQAAQAQANAEANARFARQQAERSAAQIPMDIYVVSDQRFTIFKDASGQYVTRSTSLRDGQVTYTPKPQLTSQSMPDAAVNLEV